MTDDLEKQADETPEPEAEPGENGEAGAADGTPQVEPEEGPEKQDQQTG